MILLSAFAALKCDPSWLTDNIVPMFLVMSPALAVSEMCTCWTRSW